MKKYSKLVRFSFCMAFVLSLAACSPNSKHNRSTKEEIETSQTKKELVSWNASYSNLNNQVSAEEVESLLYAYLDKNSVDEFFNSVNDYNHTVGETELTGDFKTFTTTEYDVEKISSLWGKKKGDFVGTNCRITTYTLLKNTVKIPSIQKNDELLFLDNDAIEKGNLMNDKDKQEFDILFSRVKTEATTDVKVHAEKMEKFFKQFEFNEHARMLSVVLHDNLDGEYLFVGHVGVLVPANDGFLFVEKLTFEEPYQAIKFASKEDSYKYLATKYEHYTGDGLAKPFIMDNEQWVKE